MTLRWRLVAALGLLLAVGLAVFGFGTYRVYANSQYQRLDDQLRTSIPLASRQLAQNVGLGAGPEPDDRRGADQPPAPPTVVPPGTYAELRDPSGAVVDGGRIQFDTAARQPNLPARLPDTTKLFTVGSTSGSGDWRVYVGPTTRPAGYTLVVAVPMSDVTNALHRLIAIETIAALVLLGLLSAGSWLILRHGLRPLERMAIRARSINAGDLSQRVAPADGRSEVGQLGLALNTMLGEIEVAFQERDATEQRLRQFLADASHELRTPLTSIQGFAELFRLGGGDDDQIDQALVARRIEEESARMKTLVEDLLLLARIDQTRPVERMPVDLAVLAADACTDARAVAPDRPLTLDAPDPVVVSGDRDHLRQAIANLVTNGLRHTPAGTPIEVGARVTDGHALVTVRDHGPGLDGDALEHVFDRFWQADQARVGKGAGLGLSIVAGIAHEHGGAASAANHPGGGAVFTLELPISA